MNPIAEYIRLKRQIGKISQAELAKKSGIMQRTVSEIENGKAKAKDDTLRKMLKALKEKDIESKINLLRIIERTEKTDKDKRPYLMAQITNYNSVVDLL